MPLQKTTRQKPSLEKPSGQGDYTTEIIKDREAMMNCLNYLLMEIEDAKLHTVALHLKIALHELEDISPLS
jgi:hypothetical protein